MAFLGDWVNLLWWCSILATAALLIKLLKERLVVQYRFFTSFLVWDLISALVLANTSPNKSSYAEVYFGFQSIIWILYIVTALELMTSVLRRYPGIASLGRRVLGISLGVAISGALLSMWVGVNAEPGSAPATVVVLNLFLLGRIVCLSVLIFLVANSAFLLWFPVSLPANAVRFMFGYTACFAARTATFFMVNMRGFAWSRVASAVSLSVILGCTLYWILGLNRAGEATDIRVGATLDPEHERRVIAQMEELNSRVIGTTREQ